MRRLLLIAVVLVLIVPCVSADWFNASCTSRIGTTVTAQETNDNMQIARNYSGIDNINWKKAYILRNDTNTILAFWNETNEAIWVNFSVTGGSIYGIEAYYNCNTDTPQYNVTAVMLEAYRFEPVGVIPFGTINYTEKKEGIASVDISSAQTLTLSKTYGKNITIVTNTIFYADNTATKVHGVQIILDAGTIAGVVKYPDKSTTNFCDYTWDAGFSPLPNVIVNNKWTEFKFTLNQSGGLNNYVDDVWAYGTSGRTGFNKVNLQDSFDGTRPFDLFYVYSDYGADNPTYAVGGIETYGTINLFTATAADYYDASAINTFSAYVSNATGTWLLSTTNGTIKSADIALSSLYNITITATNYFNKTYLLWNSSDTLAATPYQAVVYVSATELLTGYTVNNFSAYVPLAYNHTDNTEAALYLKAGAYTLTFVKPGYYNQTKSYTAVALSNASTTITDAHTGYINITAKELFNNSLINQFTIFVSVFNYSYTDNFTTTNGTVRFPVMNGSYNITMDAVDYALAYHTVVVSSFMANYTFSLYKTNTFYFYFRDIESKLLVEMVNLEMISGLFAGNYSAPNGTLNLSLIVPGDYTFRYTAPGYALSYYFFTLINKTVNNITLYLVSNATATDVTATVYDQIGNVIEGAVIKVLRYDLTSNSYVLSEMGLTNFEGKSILHLTLNSEFYKFLIEYGGVLKKETEPGPILQNAIAFQIVLGDEVGAVFKNYQAIDYSLIFNNATDSFRLTYSDNNNLVSSVCLNIYKITGAEMTLINTSCLSTAAGTILLGVTHTNGTTYKGSAYVYYGTDEPYLLASLLHYFPAGEITDLIGIFMVALLTIVFFCAGFWRPILIPILTPLPAVMGSLIGLIPVPIYYTLPVEVCGLIIAYVISDKS